MIEGTSQQKSNEMVKNENKTLSNFLRCSET